MSCAGKSYDLNSQFIIPKSGWPKNVRPQKVGAVAASFFPGGGAAPFGNLRVIPTDQNVRDGPTTIFGRACVVRVIEEEVTSGECWMASCRIVWRAAF